MSNLYQDELARIFRYEKLDKKLSKHVRARYEENLPDKFRSSKSKRMSIKTILGTVIALGYSRIVIGDYGAFIEVDERDMVLKNIKIKKGQEFRLSSDSAYRNLKYIWLTAIDDSNIKIYKQLKPVSYADYKEGKYYISPYEVI